MKYTKSSISYKILSENVRIRYSIDLFKCKKMYIYSNKFTFYQREFLFQISYIANIVRRLFHQDIYFLIANRVFMWNDRIPISNLCVYCVIITRQKNIEWNVIYWLILERTHLNVLHVDTKPSSWQIFIDTLIFVIHNNK